MALQPSFVLIPVVLLVPTVFSIYPRFFPYTHDNSRCTRTLNRMGTVFTGTGMGMRKYTQGLPLVILSGLELENVWVSKMTNGTWLQLVRSCTLLTVWLVPDFKLQSLQESSRYL